MIMTGVWEKGWKTLYFYDKKGKKLNPQATRTATEMLQKLQQQGRVPTDVHVSQQPMPITPWSYNQGGQAMKLRAQQRLREFFTGPADARAKKKDERHFKKRTPPPVNVDPNSDTEEPLPDSDENILFKDAADEMTAEADKTGPHSDDDNDISDDDKHTDSAGGHKTHRGTSVSPS